MPKDNMSVEELKGLTLELARSVRAKDKDMDSELFANVCVAYMWRRFGADVLREMLDDEDKMEEAFQLMYDEYTMTDHLDDIKREIGHMRDIAGPECSIKDELEDDPEDSMPESEPEDSMPESEPDDDTYDIAYRARQELIKVSVQLKHIISMLDELL